MGEINQQRPPVSDDPASARPREDSGTTREELERLVAERTKELHKANLSLKAQIAEREVVEEALLKQTKIFASILDNMSDAVIVADRNAQFLIFNPAAERMFGSGPTTTSAADWSTQGGLYLPDTSELFPADQLPLTRAIRGEDVDDVEMLVKHAAAPNGLWTRVSGRPLKDGAGGSFGGVIVCRDITGTRKEDAFREGQGRILELIAANATLAEVLTNLLLLIEAQHEEMFCSVLLLAEDGAHVRHGAAPSLPEDYVRAVDGAPIGPKNGSCGTAMYLGKQVIVTDIFADPLWEDYRELAAASGLRACWSTPILSASGKVLGTFAMYYKQPRVPTGREAKLTEVATHIAGLAIEHQRADEALRRTQGELAHVSRVTTMGELAASIAHEVNQPLGAIVGNADICLQWLKADRPNLQQLREALEDIANDGRRASEVISRIRSLVKKTAPQSASLDVNEVVSEVVSLITHEAQRRQVDLEIELEGLPPVLGDRVQLQQVLLNLAMNGIDAMSGIVDRKPQLRLTTALGDASVTVSVKDCGTGIKAEDAELVFRAFHTTKSAGMGMGLAISRSIVEAHGGRLWAEPNTDFGATFKFTLPVSEPPA
jgi:signal transduction histidine kinase/PAS domain-containing protein